MKMMKKLSLLLAVVMMISSLGLTALAGSYLGTMRVVNCDSWVSLRSYASTSASRITTVPLGAYVEAYYYNSEFTKCTYNGYTGYILSTYLTGTGNSTAASYSGSYLGKKTIVNCNEFVTLRSSPSTSASAVTRVAKGQQVDVYYYNDTFSKCYYNGLSGYILSYYLGSSYTPTPVYGNAYVVNCDEWVSLRSYASTSASRLCKVPLGACVEAYYYNSEFSECYYNGYHGYILNKYLSNSGYYYDDYYDDYARVVNCKEWVSLRSSASTTASRICKVPLGAYVERYYYNSEFSLCYYNGYCGYILNDYLQW